MARTAVFTAALAAALVLALGARTHAAERAGEPAAARDYGLALSHYATVRRSDGTYRRMLATPDAIAAAKAGQSAPDGARILMETFYRPGAASTVFHMEKVDGRWRFGSFSQGAVDLSTAPRASCATCHIGAAETDLVYTMPSLAAFAEGGGPSDFTCARGGRAPCDASVYVAGAGSDPAE